MFRIILILILFYVLYKSVKYFLRYLSEANRSNNNFNKNTPTDKYKDIEEADFKEIKDKKEE